MIAFEKKKNVTFFLCIQPALFSNNWHKPNESHFNNFIKLIMPAKVVNQIEVNASALEEDDLSYNNKNQVDKSEDKTE